MKKHILSLSIYILGILFLVGCSGDDSSDDDDTTDETTEETTDEDDEVVPVDLDFASAALTFNEDAGEQTITVDLSAAAPIAASFNVAISGTATYTDDFTTSVDGSSGSFTVNVEATDVSKTFSLTIVDDDVVEVDETIIFDITADVDGVEVGETAKLTVTITSNEEVLVGIRRNTGEMYTIDVSDGTKTKLLTIKESGGDAVTNIRSFVYDTASGLGFIGATGSNDGQMASVNMSTGIMDGLHNGETTGYTHGGLSDLLILDDQLLASTYIYDGEEPARIVTAEVAEGNGLIWFDKTDGDIDDYDVTFAAAESSGGGGLAFGGSTTHVYFGLFGGELARVKLSDGTFTSESISATKLTDFTDEDATFAVDDIYLQDFAENSNGDVYGIVYSGPSNVGNAGSEIRSTVVEETNTWFLVKVDLAEAEITYIDVLNADKTDQIHSLGFIPEALVHEWAN